MPLFYRIKGFLKAVTNGKMDTVEKYMAHSKRAKWLALRNEDNETALHIAARSQYSLTLGKLADGGAPPDETDRNGRTALNLALEGDNHEKRDEMVATLLRHGADPSLAPAPAEAPLRRALELRAYALATALLEAKADPNFGNPLQLALQSEKTLNLALRLLERGATLESAGPNPGHTAAANGRLDILKALKEKGADFKTPDRSGQTLLHRAAADGHWETVLFLLGEGLNINLQDNQGQTALHKAAIGGHSSAVQTLLSREADANLQDNQGQTALHKAAVLERTQTLNMLLRPGTRTDITDEQKLTPLALARQNGNPSAIHLLEETEKEKIAKTATPLTAGINAIPASEGEAWVKLGDHQVARVGVYPVLGRRLTEIFNFESRGLLVISENLKTGAESVTPLEKFEDLEESHLAKAIATFRSLGGKIDETALTRRMGKKPTQGLGG